MRTSYGYRKTQRKIIKLLNFICTIMKFCKDFLEQSTIIQLLFHDTFSHTKITNKLSTHILQADLLK